MLHTYIHTSPGIKGLNKLNIQFIFVFFIIELTHSKTMPENSLKIKPQPAALDFENLFVII